MSVPSRLSSANNYPLASTMRICASVFTIFTFTFITGCSKQDPNSSQASTKPPSISATAPIANPEFEAALPKVGGPAGYVGSKACQACHEDQFQSWHRSYHRTMTQVALGDAVQANFHDVVLENESTRFKLNQKEGEYWVRMEPLAQKEPGPADGLDARISLVTGSHNMQVFWLPEGDGNMQLGFPFTWLIPEKRWVPRNSTFVRRPDVRHQSEIWNVVCSRCHATGVEPHANIRERTVETQVGELGISCEACHGPGQKHVELRRVQGTEKKTGTELQTKLEPGEIIHPKKLSAERSAQVCGFCHSMKWIDKTERWQENGFRYRPGDDLEKTTPIIRPAHVGEIPGLIDYLAAHPDILDDFFWPDGMIRVSGRDYNGVIDSPCYKGGKFSCLSCHSMHESEPAAQLSEKAKNNRACTQCHEKFQEPRESAAHTHHTLNSSGSECYNCHMPHTTYGVLKAIRSHQISNPRVADEIATGRPNACNLCHLDQTLDWTAKHLHDWYGQQKPVFPEKTTNISDAVRLALAGDAGQRVLVAWHLGWSPALAISQTNWVAPLLGELLDDPYAAVRCVAERSMRKLNLLPKEYDYSVDPTKREAMKEGVWASWQERLKKERTEIPQSRSQLLLVSPKDLQTQAAAFEEWLRVRDQKPVRLRE
jgi:predicted CXXCH cytochrome family protein